MNKYINLLFIDPHSDHGLLPDPLMTLRPHFGLLPEQRPLARTQELDLMKNFLCKNICTLKKTDFYFFTLDLHHKVYVMPSFLSFIMHCNNQFYAFQTNHIK